MPAVGEDGPTKGGHQPGRFLRASQVARGSVALLAGLASGLRAWHRRAPRGGEAESRSSPSDNVLGMPPVRGVVGARELAHGVPSHSQQHRRCDAANTDSRRSGDRFGTIRQWSASRLKTRDRSRSTVASAVCRVLRGMDDAASAADRTSWRCPQLDLFPE